jgi:DNA gyrase subunit A
MDEIALHELFKESYVRYALEVIRDRALVSSLDGLKPVQRRILWAMKEDRLWSNGPTRKVAKVVGKVIGDYHPHGDASVAGAIVRLGQYWTMRVPLVIPQGNFGSPDKDPPAAQRYIEVKLSPAGEMMLEDCIPEICDFVGNYDQSCEEPIYLPSKFPNILINGHSGPAVAFQSTSACHNPNEVCDAIKYFIKNPNATIDDLIKIMPGPDWPTGGIVFSNGIKEYYETGKATLIVQAKMTIDETGNRRSISILELPYQIGVTQIKEQIESVVISEENPILSSSIESVNNYSDKEKGLYLVIELKSNSNAKLVLAELLKSKKISLRTYFSVNQNILFDRRPEQTPIITLIHTYIDHRRNIITKRCQYELSKMLERIELLEAYLLALEKIKKVIQTIEDSSNRQEAIQNVMKLLKVNERQGIAIVELQLQRLTNMERSKISEEHASLVKSIAELKEILSSQERIDQIIINELEEVKAKCGSPRLTAVVEGAPQEIQVEDITEEIDVSVMINHDMTGKIVKRFNDELTVSEKERIKSVFECKNTDYLMAFMKDGTYISNKIHSFDIHTRKTIGYNFYGADNSVISYLVVSPNDERYISILTKEGRIKKSKISEFPLLTKKSIPGIKLKEGDEVVEVIVHDSEIDYTIVTTGGMVVRYPSSTVSEMSRITTGVTGCSKNAGIPIKFIPLRETDKYLFIITQDGYGKKTSIDEFRPKLGKGGKGVSVMNHRKSKVVGACIGDDNTEIACIGNTKNSIWFKGANFRRHLRGSRGDLLIQVIMDQEIVGMEKIK